MKKYALIFTALSAFFVISCNKESVSNETNLPPVDGMKIVTLSASVAKEATKTSYSGEGSFSWTAGDEISVACSNGSFYTFTATKSGSKTKFIGYIPDGTNIGTRAYFPADPYHTDEIFSVAKEKDMTSHASADLPMVGTGVEVDGDYKFTFSHCSGAAKMTLANIPDGIKKVRISIENTSLKLSGLFNLKQISETNNYYWDPEEKSGDNEFFIRKVNVSDNSAELYIPYSCHPTYGSMWATSTINVVGYDKDNNEFELVVNKTMSSLGTFTRAQVKPLATLYASRLATINWADAGITANGSGNSRIVQWKATSDAYYIYLQYKITASKVQWEKVNDPPTAYDLSYDKSYIYTGFDIDPTNNPGNSVSGGVTLEGCEARTLVYPFKGTTEGTIEYKKGDDPRGYIQSPIGTSTGSKVFTQGRLDGDYVYIENAIPRSKIGSPVSGTTINIQPAMDYYPAYVGSITLE